MADGDAATIARGEAAKALLENDTFKTVCEDIILRLAVQWAATDALQIKEREQMHLTIQGIHAIRGELKSRENAMAKIRNDIAKRDRRDDLRKRGLSL